MYGSFTEHLHFDGINKVARIGTRSQLNADKSDKPPSETTSSNNDSSSFSERRNLRFGSIKYCSTRFTVRRTRLIVF